MNKAYLQSTKSIKGDEVYTPFYAVEPLLEFIGKDKVIWCPFDEEWSAFYRTFTTNGYTVLRSSLKDNQDFFEYEPTEHYDIIISNPPFSKKDKILKRLYELNKPFAILLPVSSIQSQERYKLFKTGLELLVFDSRIGYFTRQDFNKAKGSPHFGSAYFCHNFLPKDIVFRELTKYNKPLK